MQQISTLSGKNDISSDECRESIFLVNKDTTIQIWYCSIYPDRLRCNQNRE